MKKVLDIMRNRKFALEVLDLVEGVAGHHFYSLYALGGAKTVREWGELAEDEPRQQTSQKTVRICHDFEYAIAKVLRDTYGYQLLSKQTILESGGRYDVALKQGQSVLAFEVKTTQSSNGWTGSTHTQGTGKVPFYVLIQYKLDDDATLGTGSLYGLFKSCHFSVTSPLENGEAIIEWNGKATSSNSSTTGKIALSNADKYVPMVCLGSVSKKRKTIWAGTEAVDLHPYRDSARRLQY